MKKLFIVCAALVGFCALGQVASADPYCGGDGYYRGGHHRYQHVYRGGYGCYPYRGPRRVFVNTFFYTPPAPVYSYCPPPRPEYYEGRVVPQREYRDLAPSYDYSK